MMHWKQLFSSILILVLCSFLINSAMASSIMWSQTYGGSGADLAQSLVETSDGGYAIAGYITPIGDADDDCWFIKTDSKGNAQWNQTYGGTGDDLAYCLITTSDGGYALAGQTTSFGAADNDFWLIKTDETGNMEWNQTYGGAGDDRALSLVETSDDGYVLAGYTTSFGEGMNDFWLVKTDRYGNMEWNQTYGGANNDEATSLVLTSDRGYALTGYTESFGAGDSDFWLIKTDEFGVIPEFPSWLIPPLVLSATFIVIFFKKGSAKRQPNE